MGGVYRPIALTREPDGILKGYSAVLRLSLCWAGGRPRLYDPATNTYLEHWREVAAARDAAEAERDAAEARATAEQAARLAERAARLSEQAARQAAEQRIRQLEAELRRRAAQG